VHAGAALLGDVTAPVLFMLIAGSILGSLLGYIAFCGLQDCA